MKDPYGTKWMMFRGLLHITFGPSERGGSSVKLGTVAINQIGIGSLNILHLSLWGPEAKHTLMSLNVI